MISLRKQMASYIQADWTHPGTLWRYSKIEHRASWNLAVRLGTSPQVTVESCWHKFWTTIRLN